MGLSNKFDIMTLRCHVRVLLQVGIEEPSGCEGWSQIYRQYIEAKGFFFFDGSKEEDPHCKFLKL
jgi:hypothetical protein